MDFGVKAVATTDRACVQNNGLIDDKAALLM